MIKAEFEYELELVQSKENNLCVLLTIKTETRNKEYYGGKAVNKIYHLSHILGKAEVKRVNELYEICNKAYKEKNITN